jgi:signal transduction histidine kinase
VKRLAMKLLGISSLQRRILLLLAVVLFTTLVIIAITFLTVVSNAERDAWEGRQSEAARNATSQVANFIERMKVELEFIGQLAGDSAEIQSLIDDRIKQNPGLLEIVVVDRSGAILAATYHDEPVLARLLTIRQSNWFQTTTAGNEGTVYLGEVQLSSQNEPYMIMAGPTHFGGAVALRLNLIMLGNVVADIRLGETGTAFVVKSEGSLAADSDPGAVVNYVNLAGRPELEAARQTSKWTGAYTNFRGKQVIGTTNTIPGTDLIVFTEVEESEVYAAGHRALVQLGIMTILFFDGTMVVVTVFLRRLLFNPLERLQSGARAVEKGNLEFQVDIVRQDEIGRLTEAFNAMVRRLKAHDAERDHLIQDLQAAKRLAEDNSRLKSEFLSTMSHELRTPMNAIEGFTGIMLSRMGGVEFNNKAERYITRVNVNSKRLLQLINDFLDLSRVEAGRLELAHQLFSPADLARRWQTEIGVLAEKKNLGFDLTLDPDLPDLIYGDEEAISKVVLNLLGNAIKFTEQGKVSLSLQNDGDQWRIVVSDTGIGIPPHAREYIFEEFRQVDQSSRRKYGGSGLGLAIVQKYARTMGGTVTVQSDLGQGSTFTVFLPLEREHELETLGRVV